MTVLDSAVLVGPIYSAVGRAEYVPDKERKAQWKQVVKHLKTLCRYAEKKKKIIALEPLNRFETDFINTCDQAIQMVQRCGKSGTGHSPGYVPYEHRRKKPGCGYSSSRARCSGISMLAEAIEELQGAITLIGRVSPLRSNELATSGMYRSNPLRPMFS